MNRPKQALRDLIQEAREEWRRAVDALSQEERAAVGTFEQWTLKDTLAHSMTWQQEMLDQVAARQRGEAVAASDEFQEHNREIWEATHLLPLDEVAAENDAVYARTLALIEAVSEETLLDSTLEPRGERPLWRSLIGNAYMHPIIHLIDHYLRAGNMAEVQRLHETMAEKLPALDPSDEWQGNTRYNLACFYALNGQPDRAIPLLREALTLSPRLRAWSQQDSDLDSLRALPAFQALHAQVEA